MRADSNLGTKEISNRFQWIQVTIGKHRCVYVCVCVCVCVCVRVYVYVYVYVYVEWLIDGELKGQNSSSGSSPDRGKDELLLPLAGADGDGT